MTRSKDAVLGRLAMLAGASGMRTVPFAACAVTCALGCASGPAPRPSARISPQPATCELVGVEVIDEPAQAHTDRDAAVLMLRYRPVGSASDDQPLSLRVVVERSREEELRADLRQHSVVVCEPSRPARDGGENAPP